jgi:hypothetical protein
MGMPLPLTDDEKAKQFAVHADIEAAIHEGRRSAQEAA